MKKIPFLFLFFTTLVGMTFAQQNKFPVPTMNEVKKDFFKKSALTLEYPGLEEQEFVILHGSMKMQQVQQTVDHFTEQHCCTTIPMRERSLLEFYREYSNKKQKKIVAFYEKHYSDLATKCHPKVIMELVRNDEFDEVYSVLQQIVFIRYSIGDHFVFSPFLARRALTSELILLVSDADPKPEAILQMHKIHKILRKINVPEDELKIIQLLCNAIPEMPESDDPKKLSKT